jgi:gluconokinase
MVKKDSPLHIISVDIGTSHVKAMLYSNRSGIIGEESEHYETYYPGPDLVEQDPDEIFAATLQVIRRLVESSKVAAKDITTLVFAGIVQSLIAVDKNGNALSRALNWADRRSMAQNSHLKTRMDAEVVKQRTGCTLHPMYFPSRLLWFRQEAPDVVRRTERFISIKEFILQRLFGVKQVDYSIASATGIWNMQSKDWDQELLAEIGISMNRFSECVETNTFLAKGIKNPYAAQIGLLEGTPGVIGAFDGGLAHLGSLGIDPNRMSLTGSTGAALRRLIASPRIIPGSEAWCYYLTEGNWLLGGVLHDSGNVLKWFVDRMMPAVENDEDAYLQLDKLASETPAGADGLFFIPHLGGERCPHYHPDAKGLIYGLTFSHGLNHMVRAMMEGLSYNLYSVYRMLAPDLKPELVVSGGILKSPTWLKILANSFQRTLWLSKIKETTAWGAVMLALKATGAVQNYHELDDFLLPSENQEPEAGTGKIYQDLLAGYDQLYLQMYDTASHLKS